MPNSHDAFQSQHDRQIIIAQRAPILYLPADVRRQIYVDAGLALSRYDHPFDLSKDRKYETAEGMEQRRSTAILLLTCRQFYDEVSAIFYSERPFLLTPKRFGEFQVLSVLRPRTIALIKSLTIGVNLTTYELAGVYGKCDRGRDPRPWQLEGISKPITDPITPDNQRFMNEWKAAISHILTYVTPYQLRLRLVYDVESFRIAKLVLQPIKAAENPLADCAIRLNKSRDVALTALASSTAIQAMRKSRNNGSRTGQGFPYFKLPHEIRLRILEYTDLVTPMREVTWSYEEGYQACFSAHWNLHERRYGCAPAEPDVPQYRHCCRKSSDFCLCAKYHAAYDSKCDCWRAPQALFLVCRAFREDAEITLFRMNKIIIKPEFLAMYLLDPPETSQWLAVKFLSTIRPNAFYHLRFLEIVFPRFEPDGYPDGSLNEQRWVSVLDKVKNQFILSKLTLRIVIVASFGWHEQPDLLIDTFSRILLPFKMYTELHRFSIQLTWAGPWETEEELDKQDHADPEYLRKTRSHITSTIGSRVMGQSRYQQLSATRESTDLSQWVVQGEVLRYEYGERL